MMKRKPYELPSGPDPCPEKPVETGPDGKGVGSWVPDQKHVLLGKLLGGTKGARRKFPERVFIDPFCGPGRIRVRGESSTRDGGCAIAWRQSVADGVPFTRMLVGDIDAGRTYACRSRLLALGAPVRDFVGPAVETVERMTAEVPRTALALAYVDPYNLEFLSFDIIRALAKLRHVDLLVHFSRMDLHRNVDLELDDERARFDEAAPGWKEHLKNVSKAQLPLAFFSYWRSLVSAMGFMFSREMPLVRGDRHEPLYRLVFFSRHDLPNRIWDEVARSKNLDLFD
jgi:three-Cys-motif partner protein